MCAHGEEETMSPGNIRAKKDTGEKVCGSMPPFLKKWLEDVRAAG